MKKLIVVILALGSLSSFAADSYTCKVTGEFTNMDGDTAVVDAQVSVEFGARAVLFGRQEEPVHDFDSRPETMPWAVSIREIIDGGETPLVLSLRSPNQNASVATAYSEKGSKYIGVVIGSDLEAVCKKL